MTRLALLLLLLGAATAARAGERLDVRAVTLDVDGDPDRLARLTDALPALKPDLVCLQSVWAEADAEAAAAALAKAGLVHWRRFPSRRRGSGLLIASRWPIAAEAFTPFTLAGKPHRPDHGDWWGGPGVARVSVDTPLGRVLVAGTRLHASHGTDEYRFDQLAEALELADAVGDHGARPPEQDHDPARPPLLLLARLEVDRASLPWRLLTTRADLAPTGEAPSADAVLYRPGGDVAVKVKDAGPALDAEGVLAALELRRLGRAPRPALHALVVPWQAAAAAARPLVEAELEACRARGRIARTRALLLGLVGVALMAAGRRKRGKRPGCVLPLLALVPLHAAVWSMYLGAVHERVLEQGLVKAARQLEDD